MTSDIILIPYKVWLPPYRHDIPYNSFSVKPPGPDIPREYVVRDLIAFVEDKDDNMIVIKDRYFIYNFNEHKHVAGTISDVTCDYMGTEALDMFKVYIDKYVFLP